MGGDDRKRGHRRFPAALIWVAAPVEEQRLVDLRASRSAARRKIAIEGEQKVIKPGIAQQLSVQGSLLPMEVAEMAKIGRNDPCPCGSGKKYKQ